MSFWKLLVPVAIVAGALITILTFIFRSDPHTGESLANAPTLDTPDGAQVSRCSDFEGSAPIKSGEDLWLTVSFGNTFYWRQTVQETTSRWSAPHVTVGTASDANQRFEIRLFFIDDATSQFMRGITGWSSDGKPGYYLTIGAPPGVRAVYETSVIRNSVPNATAC